MLTNVQQNKDEVLAKGYCIIQYPNTLSRKEILASFGEVIQTSEIREHSKSTRLLASHHAMDYHTDHQAAKFIAWFCNSQSATGGESLLIDTWPIINQYSEGSSGLLQEISIQTHKVFYDDKPTLPLLTVGIENDLPSIYYASWLTCPTASIKHRRMLDKFERDVKQTQPISLLLSEGDMLIVNNHRMLHGRSGFPAGSGRWLTRYWLK